MKMNLLKKLLRFIKEKGDFFQFIFRYAIFPFLQVGVKSNLNFSLVCLTAVKSNFYKNAIVKIIRRWE